MLMERLTCEYAFFPFAQTAWPAGLSGGALACAMGQLVHSKPLWPVVLLYFMLQVSLLVILIS